MRLHWMAATLLFAFPVNANAQGVERAFYNGNDLLELCRGPAAGQCSGYVAGVADAITGGRGLKGWTPCMPHAVTIGQARDVAVRFLEMNPEIRHVTAAYLVARALDEAFPCPTTPPPASKRK